jgi:glyoxylate/hydroxypyruvate reductase A
MSIVFQGDAARGRIWQDIFAEAEPDLSFHHWPDVGDPEAVTYIVGWKPIPDLAARFPALKVMFSSGAGVDQFAPHMIPDSVSLVRMIEPGIAATMAEYVTLATLLLHRNFKAYANQQAEGRWEQIRVYPATARTVGVMGLGNLGQAALTQLGHLGFKLRGWNRSPRALDGVECFTGPAELGSFLSGCDILICMLPLTDETRGILSASLFVQLPQGAGLINVGRGAHLVEPDLLAALESGQVTSAVLDVTDVEPLPPGHPFWTHPGITLTPHIASMTQPETAARVLLDNIRRHRDGETMIGLVDLGRGY